MNWDVITGSAEILGAFAVLITLFYVALQIKRNTEEIRSSNYHGVTDSFNEINLAVANNSDLARVFRLGNEVYEKLSEEEQTQYAFFYACRFSNSGRHTISESTWNGRYDTLGI